LAYVMAKFYSIKKGKRNCRLIEKNIFKCFIFTLKIKLDTSGNSE
jgi:hypothetical protein